MCVATAIHRKSSSYVEYVTMATLSPSPPPARRAACLSTLPPAANVVAIDQQRIADHTKSSLTLPSWTSSKPPTFQVNNATKPQPLFNCYPPTSATPTTGVTCGGLQATKFLHVHNNRTRSNLANITVRTSWPLCVSRPIGFTLSHALAVCLSLKVVPQKPRGRQHYYSPVISRHTKYFHASPPSSSS